MKSKTQKYFYGQKGISLVALIVTIIVMVILAGIIIVSAVADGGIIDRAQTAVIEKERAEIEDIVKTSYVFEKVASTQNSNVGLDLKATGIAIYKNLARAGFELAKTSDVNGEKSAYLNNKDNPTEIQVSVKGDGIRYEGKLDKYGLIGKIKTIGGGEIPEEDDDPVIPDYDIKMNLSSAGNGKYSQIYTTYFYPQFDGDITNSYEYMVEKGNSKELILEQVNFIFEAEAKLRKAVDNMIENYDLETYINNPDSIDTKIDSETNTRDNEYAKMIAAYLKPYMDKNKASKDSGVEPTISEIFFDGTSPRQFATLEESIEYLKTEDRLETILRHDFIVNMFLANGNPENFDMMNTLIDDTSDDMDFATFFANLAQGENTLESIYEDFATLSNTTPEEAVADKDLNALSATSVLTSAVPQIQNSNIFELFNKNNEQLKSELGDRTLSEYIAYVLEFLSENKDHTQLESDIDEIYDILGRWEKSKGFTVADQMTKAVVGDYQNYKIEFLDETGNKIGNDYYDYFYHKASIDGEMDEYIYIDPYAQLQKSSEEGQPIVYFDSTDKITVNIYNGDELIQSTTKTLEEFKKTN